MDLTELSLEQLMSIEIRQVYGASLRTQETTDAPSSVTVVTAEEIRQRGYRTLAEVLRGAGGFYSIYDRNYVHIGLRGFLLPGDFDSRILVLVDGQRLNENVYGGAGLGYSSPIDIALVERVEIIRGPGSALYGSSAFFAVVNLVTRRGRDVDGVEVLGEAGSADTYRTRLTYGGETEGGVDWLVSGHAFTSRGKRLFFEQFAATTPSGGFTSGTDYERAYQLFGQASKGPWTLLSAYAWREKGIPTGSYDTVFDDPDNRTLDSQGFVNLTWADGIDEDTEALARLSYNDYRYRGWYIYDDSDGGGPADLLNDDRARGQWLGMDMRLSFEQLERQRWTVGSELRWNLAQDQSNEDEFGVYMDDARSGVDWGVFVQDEVLLREDLTLIAGARFDSYDSFGGTVNPRLALIYRPDAMTAWKLLYGRAFRAPNAYELYYQDGFSQVANPDLEPERIETYELIVERFIGRQSRLSTSLYHYSIEDLILQQVDPLTDLLVYRNSDSIQAEGVEVEFETFLFDDLRLTLSQALQRTRDQETDASLANSPRRISQVHIESPLFGGPHTAALEVLHVGSRKTLGGNRLGSYALTNFVLTARDLAPGLDLSLGLYNLFDRRYGDAVGAEIAHDSIEQDGFSAALRLTLHF